MTEMETRMDDSGIRGGSPTDRIIGMLLERVEAVRELHDAMRTEFHQMIETHSEVKSAMNRLVERLDSHEKADTTSFASIAHNFETLGNKIDTLGTQILATTTASRIQKAQFDAGWKVIAVVGGIVAASFAIFAIFYNHH